MFTKRESNFCKGIAIILMLFHHLFNDFEEYAGHPVNYSPFTANQVLLLAKAGKLCVAVFVFISGYGIAASYRRQFGREKNPGAREVFQFTWKRCWKLLTVYWFVFVLTLLCQPLGRTVFDAYGTGVKGFVLYFLIDAAGIANLFGTPTLNASWWYMTMALSIIIFMPFVMRLMQSFGAFLPLAACFSLFWITQLKNPDMMYLPSMLLGAFCYETQFFERAARLGEGKKYGFPIKVLCEAVVFVGLLLYRQDYIYFGAIDALLALMLALLAGTVLTRVPLISAVFEFLGKHSANMFLVHNQLYSYYFLGFFFSFRHWMLITAMLVLVSLLVSVAIEWAEEKSHYNQAMGRLGTWLLEHISAPRDISI